MNDKKEWLRVDGKAMRREPVFHQTIQLSQEVLRQEIDKNFFNVIIKYSKDKEHQNFFNYFKFI